MVVVCTYCKLYFYSFTKNLCLEIKQVNILAMLPQYQQFVMIMIVGAVTF